VLCKRSTFEAWHLFIVAHELAHCALGHIEADEVLVDCAVGEDSYLLGEDDPEEVAADEMSIAILNGEPGVTYTSRKRANAAQLERAALDYQKANQVDAGHVILNYGHRNNAWPTAQAALARMDRGDAPHKINSFLLEHLDLRQLPLSSVEYLLKITDMYASDEATDGLE